MKYANLWASCACLLLLQLEMGAAKPTVSGPSESLYATARDLGLDAAGLEKIWRTGMPLVIRNERGPNYVTTVTYTLGPDRRTITKRRETKFQFTVSFRENRDQTDPEFFLSPFLNPFGSGFTQDNPSAGPPSERPKSTPNVDESNSNDSQWVPVPKDTTRAPLVPLPTLAPSNNKRGDSVIDDFLAKVDVTTADIKNEDGEYNRKIVDKNGRILNAKFELIENESEDGKRPSK